MDEYKVFVPPSVERQLDGIYAYVYGELHAPQAALNTLSAIKEAILSLAHLPLRGAEVKRRSLAGQGYRFIRVKNYVIVYRVDGKHVVISSVRHARSNW